MQFGLHPPFIRATPEESMSRLFGFIGNRPDLASRVLDVEAAALKVHTSSRRVGWGLGFYQGADVLLRRRPVDDRAVIDVASLTRDVRADVLVGNVRAAGQGEPRTENTQPFRYRQWLFAHSGEVAEFDRLRDRLTSSIPDFLQRNVRGETDSELLFYLFLSFLHDAGSLQDSTAAPVVTTALRSTLALVDRLCEEEGAADAGPTGFMVSNGEYLAVLNRNAGIAWRAVRGEADIEALLPEDGLRRIRLPDMARVRFTLVAGGFTDELPRWNLLPDRATVVFGRLEEPVVEPI
jgi:predicted glutamine amidotransferase